MGLRTQWLALDDTLLMGENDAHVAELFNGTGMDVRVVPDQGVTPRRVIPLDPGTGSPGPLSRCSSADRAAGLLPCEPEFESTYRATTERATSAVLGTQ